MFLPLLGEAMHFSIFYLKDSRSCPIRLLSTGLKAIVRLPTVTTFRAIPEQYMPVFRENSVIAGDLQVSNSGHGVCVRVCIFEGRCKFSGQRHPFQD